MKPLTKEIVKKIVKTTKQEKGTFQLIATKVSEDGDILTIVKFTNSLDIYYQGMIDANTCIVEKHFMIDKSEILELVIKEGYRLTPLGKKEIK
jgi:hypothetical protein